MQANTHSTSSSFQVIRMNETNFQQPRKRKLNYF